MTQHILILAGDTDGNLGDLAIVSATCDYLRRLDPDVEISLVTSRPARDRERLGIHPIRRGWRGLPDLVAAARRADLVICGGGGLFQDDDSLLKMPYWALRLLFVKLLCRRIAGLSIGAGPLDHGISRIFARLALRTLAPLTVRDAAARQVLAPLSPNGIEVVPDPAFLLQPATKHDARLRLREAGVPLDGPPLIGVAVRRWFHTRSNLVPHKYAHGLGFGRHRGREPMAVFVRRVAAVLDEVVAATRGHVVFLPTYNVGHENDLAVCEAIAESMQSASRTTLTLEDPKMYKAVSGLLSVMLCGRMHPAILAAAEGTPVVGLAYNPKFFGAFSLLGIRDRCLAISDFVANDLSHDVSRLLLEAIEHPAERRVQTSLLEQQTRLYLEKLMAGEFDVAGAARAVAPQTRQ